MWPISSSIIAVELLDSQGIIPIELYLPELQGHIKDCTNINLAIYQLVLHLRYIT